MRIQFPTLVPSRGKTMRKENRDLHFGAWTSALLLALVTGVVTPSSAGTGKDRVSYGEGLIVNIPAPTPEVEQVVEDVVQNGIIRGTKEYNKDEFVSGAKAASSSHVFSQWDQGGRVFYKVRNEAIDPRNFKDSGDIGTLVVRYVVMPQGEKNTILRIDALFQEDFRKTIHQSNGSIEAAEYKDIQEHLEAIQVMKQQNVEAQKERQQILAKKSSAGMWGETQFEPQGESSSRAETPEATAVTAQPAESSAPPPAIAAATPQPDALALRPGETLEEHVHNLRKRVEATVKSPGAPLKSAPFHTASTLQSLAPGTEVLIVITSPYWYGIETHEGQHGWIMRDELEQQP